MSGIKVRGSAGLLYQHQWKKEKTVSTNISKTPTLSVCVCVHHTGWRTPRRCVYVVWSPGWLELSQGLKANKSCQVQRTWIWMSDVWWFSSFLPSCLSSGSEIKWDFLLLLIFFTHLQCLCFCFFLPLSVFPSIAAPLLNLNLSWIKGVRALL